MKILLALIKKEIKQILRDPSSIVIAFILPIISITIYMYGINLDSVKITLGIKNDDNSPEVATLVKSFGHSKYINSINYDNMEDIKTAILSSKIKGAVIIPNDFSAKLSRGQRADLLVITDGSEVNTANYVQSYANMISNQWLAMLTSLVIAREWERGTMEALLSTKVRAIHIVLGKYIPYFILGMLSTAFNMFLCVCVFQVPFRGSYFMFFLISGIFLFTSLGIGLMISTALKNQFMASMVSISLGFMPALMLSGLMFPINSMPTFFQYLTMIIPPRYYISFIESEFMAGGVNEIRLANAFYLTLLGLLLFAGVYKKTQMRLETASPRTNGRGSGKEADYD